MKTMKLALLGTAALAATSLAARADDLSALKAEIEALNARVAQLEAAPAVPAGYQLLSLSTAPAVGWDGLEKNSDFVGMVRNAHVIGIMPTADMPATTQIEWHGQIRTVLSYEDAEAVGWEQDHSTDGSALSLDGFKVDSEDEMDVNVRGRLWVRAVTDTAVGEVGVAMRVQGGVGIADGGENATVNLAWGWWQMTPEFQLAGGYTDSLAAIQKGLDWNSTYYTGYGGVSNRSADAMRLTYNSGPLSFAVAVEESEAPNDGGLAAVITGATTADAAPVTATVSAPTDGDRGDMPAIAGRVAYAGDMFAAEVVGIWQDDDGHKVNVGWDLEGDSTDPAAFSDTASLTAQGDDDFFVGGGLAFTHEMFTLEGAAGYGEGYAGGYSGAGAVAGDDSYWGGSVLARVNMTDTAYLEAGYAYSELDWLETYADSDASTGDDSEITTQTVTVGMFYAPVAQLTLGVQGSYSWVDTEVDREDLGGSGTISAWADVSHDELAINFISWFSF